MAVSVAERLAPFAPRLSVEWLRHRDASPIQRIDGTVAFVDVSGFTSLTERLAARGKVGAEEVSEIIGGVFTELLDIGYEYGGELLKWGGDAALILIREPGSARRACRAAWLMSRAIRRVGDLKTSVGRVRLGISIGVHRGTFDLYMLGRHHKELIITGPAATVTAQMESVAESGEVLVSKACAAELDDDCLGPPKESGVLLRRSPAAEARPNRSPVDVSGVDVSSLFAPPTLEHLGQEGETAEHRHAVVGFIEFSGIDDLTAEQGHEVVAVELDKVICNVGDAAMRHGATFHETDIGPGGGKILLLAGVPLAKANDEDRLLRVLHETLDANDGPISLRAGITCGRIFMHQTGPPYRRIHSVSGDTVNLAARLMARAGAGELLAVPSVLEKARSTFEATAIEPFRAKGKAELVQAFVVGAPKARRATRSSSGLPLVGRDRELALLLDAAAAISSTGGTTVDLVAEPGMGKTRLMTETVERAGLPSYWVMCEELSGGAPYESFRRLLLEVLGEPDDTAPARIVDALVTRVSTDIPELIPWLPLLSDILDVELPETVEVQSLQARFRQARLHETVLTLLERSLIEPTVIVFEDVHWMDDASRELLGRLVLSCRAHPWLIVIARRSGDIPAIPEEADGLSRIVLEALDGTAAAQLLTAATGDLPLRPGDREQLVARAAGNPLFLRELVTAFDHAGSVEALPDSIEPLFAAQVDRLAARDRQVLRAAAVLGTHFDSELLADLLDTPSALEDGVWERVGDLVVVEGPTARRFSHALLRDAAYEGLSFRRRRDLHGRAAHAIESRTTRPEEQSELLSLHYSAAEWHQPAWRFSRLAGDRASRVYANADAAGFYRRALDAAAYLNDVPGTDVAMVAEALGDSAELASDYDAARQAFAKARQISPAAADRARLLRKTGVIHERLGGYQQALRCYTRGRGLVPEGAEPAGSERSDLAIAYAGVRYRQGHLRDCLHWAETAATEAKAADHRPGLAHALYLQDLALSDMAEPSGQQAIKALKIYEELGDLVSQGHVLNNLGVNAYYLGQWVEALDYYRRSAAVRERAGDVNNVATQENNIAEILSDQGHFDEARRRLQSANTTWRSTGYHLGVALTLSNLGRLAARSGQPDEAAGLLAEALDRFQRIGASALRVEAEVRHAEALLFGGAAPAAVEAASRLLSVLSSIDTGEVLALAVHRILGVGYALTGDPRGARREVDAAVARARRHAADYELAQSLAARAFIATQANDVDIDSIDDETEPSADAKEARTLFARLDVTRSIVTACDDPWPEGPTATALSMAVAVETSDRGAVVLGNGDRRRP